MKSAMIRLMHNAGMVLAALLVLTLKATGQTIAFDTEPYDPSTATTASGVAGEAYTYDANATASNSGTIKYVLRYGPSGMAVNENTGVVSWTPPRAGTYLVELRAQLASNPSVYSLQGWAVLVTECAGNAIISGSVMDQNGNPVQSGTVTAQVVGQTRTPLTKVVAEIQNGTYSMVVDQATYALRVEGEGMISEWYKDGKNFSEANLLTTQCEQTTTADFEVVVYDVDILVDGNVGGRVVDAATDLPIGGADISVKVVSAAAWRSADEQWKIKLYGGPSVLWDIDGLVSSNSDGAYWTGFGPITPTVWFASMRFGINAIDDHDRSWNVDRQYYDYTANPVAARPLYMTTDTTITNVNFRVKKPDTLIYLRYNTFYANPDHKGNILVIALAVEELPGGRYRVDPARSVKGAQLLSRAKYLLFAIPSDTNYVPGFYRVGDTATLSPSMATLIDTDTLDHNLGSGYQHDFVLRLKRPTSGTSDIRGMVDVTASRTEKDGATVQSVSPLTGAFVYALDSTGGVAAYTFSNDDGSYVLKGLGAGTYQVHSNMIGYLSGEPHSVTVSGNGELAAASFLLEENIVSAVPGSRNVQQITSSVQPNPATGDAVIHFEGKTGKARLSLVAADGNEVLSKEIMTIAGENRTVVNVSNLPSGVYVGTIEGTGYAATVRITVAH